MPEIKNYDEVTKVNTEYLADRSRIYTFEWEDGKQLSFILPVAEIREFLKGVYEKRCENGETFGPDEYEDKREEYLLSAK